MPSTDVIGVFALLVAALSFLNNRYWKLPPTIGILIGGLVMAGIVAVLDAFGAPIGAQVRSTVNAIPFGTLVFQWLLSFLLFASAIQVNVRALFRERLAVTAMTLITTLLTMLLVGTGVYALLRLVGLPVSYPQALLFGAIVAPTDPVAVLPLLRAARVPSRIEALIAGESLFNDGVGVVAFTVLVAVTPPNPEAVTITGTLLLFLREMLGGVLLGAVLGWLAVLIQRRTKDENTRLLISLALVLGGNALAQRLGVSAPVTVAMGGLTLVALVQLWKQFAERSGLLTRLPAEQRHALERAQRRISSFWSFVDYILNAALFAVLAFEVLILQFDLRRLLLALVVVVLALMARAVGVWLPVTLLARRQPFPPYTRRLMTWAGLRGGVTLALAFNLPTGAVRDLFLIFSYAVVVFGMLVQGLSIPVLARRAALLEAAAD